MDEVSMFFRLGHPFLFVWFNLFRSNQGFISRPQRLGGLHTQHSVKHNKLCVLFVVDRSKPSGPRRASSSTGMGGSSTTGAVK